MIDINSKIFSVVNAVLDNKAKDLTLESVLLGESSLLDSMKLVELCLALEDMAVDLGFEFDWTSELAMSRSHSMFRTIGSLAAEFISQMEGAQQ